MSAPARLLALALPALVAFGALPRAAAAQVPPLKVAIDLTRENDRHSRPVDSESVARRVMTFLVPAMEAQGYEVVRVKDWENATDSGHYEAVVRLLVDAQPLVVVHDAYAFDNDDPRPVADIPRQKRQTLHYQESRSVEAWASWKAWDGKSGRRVAHARIPPLQADLQGSGSSATLDDEENVARILADEIAKSLVPVINVIVQPRSR